MQLVIWPDSPLLIHLYRLHYNPNGALYRYDVTEHVRRKLQNFWKDSPKEQAQLSTMTVVTHL